MLIMLHREAHCCRVWACLWCGVSSPVLCLCLFRHQGTVPDRSVPLVLPRFSACSCQLACSLPHSCPQISGPGQTTSASPPIPRHPLGMDTFLAPTYSHQTSEGGGNTVCNSAPANHPPPHVPVQGTVRPVSWRVILQRVAYVDSPSLATHEISRQPITCHMSHATRIR